MEVYDRGVIALIANHSGVISGRLYLIKLLEPLALSPPIVPPVCARPWTGIWEEEKPARKE